MKKVFGLCLLIFIVGCTPPSWHDSNGNRYNLANYHGKWVLINYWATWCKACYREMPALNAFYQQHKDTDAMVFGVNYDKGTGVGVTDKKELLQLIARMGAIFPTLIADPGIQFGINHIPGLPTTLVIDPNGKLKQTLVGEQTKQSLERAIGA